LKRPVLKRYQKLWNMQVKFYKKRSSHTAGSGKKLQRKKVKNGKSIFTLIHQKGEKLNTFEKVEKIN
jgi:hypothetical protein